MSTLITYSIDSDLSHLANLKTFSINADLKLTRTVTYQIDADLKKLINLKVYTVDAFIKINRTKTYSVDADLKQIAKGSIGPTWIGNTASASADSALLGSYIPHIAVKRVLAGDLLYSITISDSIYTVSYTDTSGVAPWTKLHDVTVGTARFTCWVRRADSNDANVGINVSMGSWQASGTSHRSLNRVEVYRNANQVAEAIQTAASSTNIIAPSVASISGGTLVGVFAGDVAAISHITLPGSFTSRAPSNLDAVVAFPTEENTGDMIISGPNTGIQTATSSVAANNIGWAISLSGPLSYATDAIIKTFKTRSFSIDSLTRKRRSTSYKINAFIGIVSNIGSDALNLALEQFEISVKPKVIIEFGNNRFNDDQVCTASSTKVVHRGISGTTKVDPFPFWSPDDAYNNKNRNSMQWGVCDHGAKADGTYRAIPSEFNLVDGPAYERGWWSANKSNGSGVFTSPEWVMAEWTTPRNINMVELWLTEGYPTMTDFTIQYKNNSNVWIDVTVNDGGSAIYDWKYNLDSTVECKGLRVYINATEHINDFARVSELQGLLVADVSSDVINLNENQDREEYINTVPVGTTRANTLSLALQNVDQKYSPENISSIYYPYITANNKINLSYGIQELPLEGTWYNIPGLPDPAIWLDLGWDISSSISVAIPAGMPVPTFNDYIFGWMINKQDFQIGDIPAFPQDTPAGDYYFSTGGLGAGGGSVASGHSVHTTVYIACSDSFDFYFDGVLVSLDNPSNTTIIGPTATDVGPSSIIHYWTARVKRTSNTGQAWILFVSKEQTDSNTPLYFSYTFTFAKNNYEYIKQGTYYTDTWNVDGDSLQAKTDCRDFSKFMQDEKVLFFGKVWQNTTIAVVLRDVLNRLGKTNSEIVIDNEALRTFEILFLKDKIIWAFIAEVAFADQGMFGFDEDGSFTYQSYNRLNEPPFNTVQYTLDQDINIISAHEETELYINSVIAKVSNYSLKNLGRKAIWHPNDTALGWGTLNASINSTATTLTLNQNMSDQTANNFSGIWGDSGWCYIDTELIYFGSRSSTQLFELIRGFGDTVPASHLANTLVGEAMYWELTFDTPPAFNVAYPFITAIDTLITLPSEGTAQAKVVLFDPNPFGAKLAIANIVNYITVLEGSAVGSQKNPNDAITWSTEIAGNVLIPKATKETVGGVPVGKTSATNKWSKYIRRYGKNEIVIDNPWIENIAHATQITDLLIDEYKNPRQILAGKMLGNPALKLATRVEIANYDQLSIYNRQYNVISLRYSYDGSLLVDFILREVKQ